MEGPKIGLLLPSQVPPNRQALHPAAPLSECHGPTYLLFISIEFSSFYSHTLSSSSASLQTFLILLLVNVQRHLRQASYYRLSTFHLGIFSFTHSPFIDIIRKQKSLDDLKAHLPNHVNSLQNLRPYPRSHGRSGPLPAARVGRIQRS